MSRDTLNQMATVTEAMFQREYSAIKSILKEEADLRRALLQLKEQSIEARTVSSNSHAMQSTGADFLWQSWVARNRRQLNIELAQTMARKIEAMQHVRKAFGRNEAVKSLVQTAHSERALKIARIRAEQIMAFNT